MNLPDKDLHFARPTRFYLYYDKYQASPGKDPHRFKICVGGCYFFCKGIDIQCPTKAVIDVNHTPKAFVEGMTTHIEIGEDDFYTVR